MKTYTRDEACTENWKRYDEERNVVYPSMLTNFNSLSLRRIDITGKDRNNHESSDIDKTKYYLIGYSGQWKISKAYRDYWDKGWQFDVGSYRTGLRLLDILFELVDMPSYESDPLGRVEPEYDEEDDDARW